MRRIELLGGLRERNGDEFCAETLILQRRRNAENGKIPRVGRRDAFRVRGHCRDDGAIIFKTARRENFFERRVFCLLQCFRDARRLRQQPQRRAAVLLRNQFHLAIGARFDQRISKIRA